MKFNLKYKIAGALLFAAILYFANKDQHEVTKTKSQIQYETWLTETESKSRASINNEPLPSLSLTIIPSKNSAPAIENIINANNISDSKEKILRLLSLISEAGLYNYQTEKLNTSPGDIVLKIQASEKLFTLQFQPSDIESNIKASLMLKLYQEYAKEKIPENLANRNATTSVTGIKDSIFALFEEPAKNK